MRIRERIRELVSGPKGNNFRGTGMIGNSRGRLERYARKRPEVDQADESASCKAALGRTPMKLSLTSPFLNNSSVGMLLIPNF